MDSLGLVRPAAAAQATAATAVKSRETEKTSSGRARPAPLKLCSARATPALSPSRATSSAPRPATAFKLISPATRSLALAALQAAALTLVILVFGSCVAVAATASVDSDSDSDSGSAQSILESFQFNSLVLVDEAAEAPKPPGAGDPASPHASNLTALLAALYPGSGSGTGAGSGGLNGSLLGPPSLGAGGTSAATAALGELLDGPFNASEPATTTAPEGPEPEPEYALPPLHAIAVSVVLLFVILGTVVGNVLVCIAVCMVRKLRRPCNYLLVSLALSDLCVAVLVMPMALLYEVLEKWAFGPLLCDIWVSFDVLCCTASILNLCAISVDRYLAITKPLEYGVKRTPRRMMLCVALVWLAAACISLPPLLILGNEHQDEHGEPICAVCQNFAYQIYATLGSFYIPLAVMLFVYYQIFRAARRIVLEEKRAQTHLQHALNGAASAPQPPPPAPATGATDLSSGNGLRHSSCGNTSLTYSTCGGGGGHGAGGSGSSGLLGSPHHKKLRFQLAKEKKASTTLGIIMSAFTVCWLPFFILALIRPFVESETTHVPQTLSSLFLWLGYANSLLNPIIYATLNRDFRKPFQEILYFRCSSLNTMMRENYYQDQYGEPPSQRVMLGDERQGARESFL